MIRRIAFAAAGVAALLLTMPTAVSAQSCVAFQPNVLIIYDSSASMLARARCSAAAYM